MLEKGWCILLGNINFVMLEKGWYILLGNINFVMLEKSWCILLGNINFFMLEKGWCILLSYTIYKKNEMLFIMSLVSHSLSLSLGCLHLHWMMGYVRTCGEIIWTILVIQEHLSLLIGICCSVVFKIGCLMTFVIQI